MLLAQMPLVGAFVHGFLAQHPQQAGRDGRVRLPRLGPVAQGAEKFRDHLRNGFPALFRRLLGLADQFVFHAQRQLHVHAV